MERLQSDGVLPDLVISDLRMPYMDGSELLRAMQAAPELRNIPVILLTGDDDHGTRMDMLDLGVADYLAKPFPSGELLLRVRNTLRGVLLLREVDEARRSTEIANAELREVNAELDRFAATAAHDLQAPLTNIAGYAGLLADGLVSDPEQQEKLLRAISDNAMRADALIRDLLQHARTIASVDDFEALDLAIPIGRASRHLETAILQSSAKIQPEPDLAPVRARPVAVESLMLNLLSNAIKYRHPDRKPVIGIRTVEATQEDFVEVVVTDNGQGIPEEEKERVFGLLEQGSNREEGTGIGLATARLVVARHGGRIWLDDAPDPGGLEVHFTLPAA